MQIEAKALTPMMKQYLEIKQECTDALLLYRLGDFYELFFDDAVTAAKILDITLTCRNKNSDDPVPLCGVPYHSVEPYITKLLEAGKKVAICDQIENPAESKGVVKRAITQILTPGAIASSEHLSAKKNNYIACVYEKKGQFAFSLADLSTGFFSLAVTSLAEELLDVLSHYEPQEFLLSDQASERLLSLLKPVFSKALFSTTASRNFNSAGVKPFISDELEAELEEIAFDTAGALHRYLTELQKAPLKHIEAFQSLSLQDHMLLDLATKQNLELTTTLREGKHEGSLLWLLDKTSSAMGARLLRSWIVQPLLSRKKIEERLDIVEAFMSSGEFLRKVKNVFEQVYDLERITTKVLLESAHARDLLALADTLALVPELKKLFSEEGGALKKLAEEMSSFPELVEKVKESLLDEPSLSLRDGFIMRDGISPELDELRSLARDGKKMIAAIEAEERAKTGIHSLKIKYNKVFGYFLEVTHAHTEKIPAHYIRKQTLVNAERYITEELKILEEKVLGAEDKMKALEYQLFVQLRTWAAQYGVHVFSLARLLAKADVLLSFALVSLEKAYTRPVFSQATDLHFEQSRHPVVESICEERFVPNDVHLSEKDGNCLLITGPNMAGKSTLMRQVALMALMAQIGCFVPARHAKLGIVDRIFTRIGASDALWKGHSTFMVEMSEMAHILKKATEKSLIIVDEIGRGTSTFDGLSLAWALAEDLHDRIKARTLFATHYHELIELAESKAHMRNFHIAVKESEGGVVFLRTLLPGGASHSYGIEVASLAGIPLHITQKAKKVMKQLEARTAAANDQKHTPPQLSFFEPDLRHKDIVEELAQLNPNQLTPLEALQFLSQMKGKISEKA